MKLLIVIFTLVIIQVHSLSLEDRFKRSLLRGPTLRNVGVTQPKNCNASATEDEAICLNCNEAAFCHAGSATPAQNFSCADIDPKYPYCYKAQCVSESTCPVQAVPKMDCNYADKFPDPESCSNFIACPGPGTKNGWSYNCANLTKYDPVAKVCSAASTVPCANFSTKPGGLCAQNLFKPVAHPYDDRLYVICPGVFKTCPSPSQKFDNTSKKCEFVCRSLGFFKDPDSVDKYYTCIKVGSPGFLQPCVQGTTWKDSINFCG